MLIKSIFFPSKTKVISKFAGKKIDFSNNQTNKPANIVIIIGENGAGKTRFIEHIQSLIEAHNKDCEEILKKKIEKSKIFSSSSTIQLTYEINNKQYTDTFIFWLSGSGNAYYEPHAYPPSLADISPLYKDLNNDLTFPKHLYHHDNNHFNGVKSAIKVINRHFDENGSYTDEIKTFLKDESNLKIKYNDTSGNLEITKEANKGIYFDNLSSGEKHILCLISTIIESKTKLFFLDELENSFSPKHQEEIISKYVKLLNELLKDNYQLFIATHSPFILKKIFKL